MTAEDDIGDILDEIDRNLNGDEQKQGMKYYVIMGISQEHAQSPHKIHKLRDSRTWSKF